MEGEQKKPGTKMAKPALADRHSCNHKFYFNYLE